MKNIGIFIFFLILIDVGDCEALERVQPDVAKQFGKIRKAIDAKDFFAAIKGIDRVESSTELNGIELAYVSSYRANVEFHQGNLDLAIENYKKVLKLESNLPLWYSNGIRFVVAQIEFTQKRYSESIVHAEKWLCRESDPSYDGLMLLAQAYYLIEDYESARSYITKGMKKHALENNEPKSGWVHLFYKIYRNVSTDSAEDVKGVIRTVLEGIYPRANIKFWDGIECDPYNEIAIEVEGQAQCEFKNS